MYYPEKEFIFLSFCWLSLGTLGVLVEPYPDNKAVLTGTANVSIACYSSSSTNYIGFFYTPVGNNREVNALQADPSEVRGQSKFAVDGSGANKRLIIKNASMLMAGTYYCTETTKMNVQIIVLSDNPTCDFSPNQTKQLMCNETMTLSCSVSYTANWTYVVPNIKWSTKASSSKALKGSMDISRSGNLTIATSTLSITWPVDGAGAMPIYSCNTTFGLVDGLSKEFATKPPDYYNLCQPFTSADDVPCIKVERKKDTETTITPDDSTDLAEKSGDASDGTSIVSSDTTTVFIVLCIAGSLLLPQELEGENLH